MKILFSILPGCLPNLVHDPGKWWDRLAANPDHDCLYFNANEIWWREICSSSFVQTLAGKMPLANIIAERLSASSGVTAMERLAARAGASLEAMRMPGTYASASAFAIALKPFSDYLRVFNFLIDEFSVGIENGASVKGMNYRETSEMLAFSLRDTVLLTSYRKVVGRIPFSPEACFIPVTSEYDLLSAMVWAQCLKEKWPGIYVCVIDPGYENFSLDWQSEAICKTGALFNAVDSVLKHSYQAERVIPLLILELAAGRRPSGFLEARDFTGETPVSTCEVCPPLINVFTPEPFFLLRLSGKGCYWNKCSFCAQHSKHESLDVPDNNDVASTFWRIVKLRNIGYKYFYFEDEAVHPALLNYFCDLVISNGLDIKWGCRCRLDSRHPDAMFEKLKRAGCCEIFFGVETVVPRVQALMRKYSEPIGPGIVKAVIEAASAAGLGLHLTFIIGFPGETLAESRATLDFMSNTFKEMPRVTYHVGRLKLLPQADTYKNAPKYCISPAPFNGDLNCYCEYSLTDTVLVEADKFMAENLPEMLRGLDASLGWDMFEKTPESKLIKNLYFNYAIRTYIKSRVTDIFSDRKLFSM